jgi:hypothetical protein
MEKPEQVIDFAYLESFLAGDVAVIRDVLALFVQQSERWLPGLDSTRPGWREVAHTVKGAALGVGAGALAEACERAEAGDPDAARQARGVLQAAVTDINAYLAA